MRYCKLAISASIILFSIQGKAQHLGPSLTASTSKIAYEKGTLDSEVILELVATKQEEIRSELMHRLVLNHFECGSFATWNFVRSNLNLLIDEKDKRVMTKEMLKNATELAIVMGISEYYLKFLANKDSLNDDERKFLKQFFKWTDTEGLANGTNYFDGLGRVADEKQQNKPTGTRVVSEALSSSSIESFGESTLPPLEFLKQFKNEGKGYREKKQSFDKGMNSFCDNISPNHIFIDFVLDVCLNNDELKKYGFFSDLKASDDIYKAKSKFLIFRETNQLRKEFDSIRDELNELINTIFGSFETIQYLYQENKSINVSSIVSAAASLSSAGSSLEDLQQSVKELDLSNLSETIRKDWEEEVTNLLTFIKYRGDENNDLLFFAEEKVLPALVKLNFATSRDLSSVITDSEAFVSRIRKDILAQFKTEFDALLTKVGLTSSDAIDFANFIELVKQIKNLDNPSTYQTIATFLVGAGEIFGDDRTKNLFNKMVGDFDKYLIVDVEKEELTLEVEDMAIDLYKKYGQNQTSNFGLYFGVGVNTGSPSGELDDQLESDLYYVSEKIGFRYKLINWNRLHHYGSANKMSKKASLRRSNSRAPIINDLHLLAYGSGLLYQIDFLNSEDEVFTKPTFGIGLGVGFFNGLDFNVSYAKNFGFDGDYFENGFLNIGFDIKIVEYIGAVRSKNK